MLCYADLYQRVDIPKTLIFMMAFPTQVIFPIPIVTAWRLLKRIASRGG